MRFDPRLWRGGPLTEHIGDLDVPSGRLAVCDAGTLFQPVGVDVAAGRHAVRVLRNRDGENLAAAVRVGPGEPARWEERGAYGVDAGMAGFFDQATLAKLEAHDFASSIYDDLISKHLDPAEAQGHAGAMVPFEGSGFAACASGYGDGTYGVYVGIDPRGGVAVVVTEFIGPDDEDLEDELDVEDAPTEQG